MGRGLQRSLKRVSPSVPKDLPLPIFLDQFKDAFDREEHLVSAIKQYLRTEEQRKWLYDHDLSIEDCLNGRYPGDLEEEVAEVLYKPWNEILGFREFGS